jgi:hypothetical protein
VACDYWSAFYDSSISLTSIHRLDRPPFTSFDIQKANACNSIASSFNVSKDLMRLAAADPLIRHFLSFEEPCFLSYMLAQDVSDLSYLEWINSINSLSITFFSVWRQIQLLDKTWVFQKTMFCLTTHY